MDENKEELLFKTRESYITVISWKRVLVGLVLTLLLIGTILIDFSKDVKSVLYWCDAALILCFIIYILTCMWLKSLHRIYVYRDHIHERMGLLNVVETDAPLAKLSAVTIKTPFWGSIFNYGTLYLDAVGKIDIHSENIKRAKKMKIIFNELINDINDNRNHD